MASNTSQRKAQTIILAAKVADYREWWLTADCGSCGPFSTDTFFTAQDRRVWASGAGFTFDTGQRFLGTSWNIGKIIGGIDETRVFGICADFGAEVGAKTSRKVGIDYSLKVHSGTFDLQLPAARRSPCRTRRRA